MEAASLSFENEQDRQCTYKVTLRSVRITIVAVEKQYVLNILSLSVCVCVCVLALVIRYAKRMRRIILPSVACLGLPYFSS
jgi:predicted exporter